MNEINVTNKKLSKNVLHRLGTLVLALCMALSLLPAVSPQADAAFSDAAMDKLLNWDVISGYPDGGLHPERSLTRAEFVAMTNRAYGYKELGVTPFIDVPNDAWYRDDINIGYNAKYFTGVSPRMAAPDQTLTREQAVVLLGRNMRLQPLEGEVIEFTDGHDFSPWSRGYVRAAKQAGIIGGYANGTYKPQNSITRGEMSVMLERALGTLINKPGTHTLSDVYGNVTISSPNVVLKNSTIVGDLYITGGLSLGDVTLENVRVLGNIIIAGGGESESGESVILRNVQANSLIVDSIAQQYLSLAAEGDTSIGDAILRSSAYVQDRTRPGSGLLKITLDSLEPNAVFTLSGNLETVVNKTPNSTLNIAMGTVDNMTIDELARGSTLNLDINSTVKKLNLDTGIHVTGVGDIGDLFVNAPGCVVDMLPDSVTIRPGLTADIAGQTMNAQQAQESSSDPRLNAGYPRVKNVAPTNATSVYSANKNGTVYWAVSNTTDGSIGEDELIEPTTDNTRITLSGTTPVGQSNTEYTSALDKLTPDSNYYLSTIMMDARGRRSPIKVTSFTTPDNTVPAFAQGYPAVMKNYCQSITGEVELNGVTVRVVQRDEDGYPKRNYRVQIAAMPNKTCQLYYALYPKGSNAPTAQQFRTGSLGGPIRSGMEDATKNRINFIELTGLEELTEYDIYLCYIDADGARSSPVQKLTFKTVDGKPPRFQYETPVVTQELLTSLRLSVNVNENATVYWVATRDANYVKTGNWTETEWWERACRQIESGTGGIRSGSVNARANADTTVNVTGLEAATRYYIFFVAKDAAGNYSEFFSSGPLNVGGTRDEKHPELYTPHNQQPYKYFLAASTLDNIPPTATQEFTHYDAADETRPYADTDIMIHFSEAVMRYSTHTTASSDDFQDFYKLYTDMLDARAKDEAGSTEETKSIRAATEAKFCDTLRATIKLYNNAATGNDSVPERDDTNEASIGDDWVIDYRKVTVEYDADTGVMTVVFPTDPESTENSALNLASGATYHFVLDDICDTSSNKNRMGRYPLPDFTTISAQVQLRTINVTRVSYTNTEDGNKMENIPIDMAFSMTPISTSVEDNVDWDILFWSDTSCEFEVYEISTNANGASAVAIRPLSGNKFTSPTGNGHYSVPLVVENVEAPDADTTADNYRGYLGQSYFNKFYGVSGTFPSVTGKGNVLATYSASADINARGIMERNKSKFYGIHFTSIDNVPEGTGRDKIWDATVNFRISVVTASSSSNLDNLSKDISNRTITNFDGDTALGGSLIHSPRPFTMRKQFANSAAPEFDPDYPYFNPADTYVEMTLMLDRPGTVYYVVAPASTWSTSGTNSKRTKSYAPTITTFALDGTPNGDRLRTPTETTDNAKPAYERYWAKIDDEDIFVPRDSGDRIVPAYNPETKKFDHSDLGKTAKFELVTPANSLIYGSRDFGAGTKTGNVTLGSGSRVVTVEGLEPETVYLVYFVMQGTGQVYSERAQLFQFSTTKIRRPNLTVQNLTSSAFITSDMNATVDAGIFRDDSLQQLTLFSTKFFTESREYIDPGVSDSVWKDYFEGKDSADRPYKDYALWETLLTPAPRGEGGSLFDYFANEATKDNVANLIRTRDPNGIGATVVSKDLIKDTGEPFDEYTLEPGLTYVLFAVAKGSDNASGHSLGFGAAYPLYQSDNAKPAIRSILAGEGGITVDYQTSGKLMMYGTLDLTFTHRLYLCDDSTRPATRTALTKTAVPTSFIQSNKNQFSATSSDNGAVQIVTVALNPKDKGGVPDNSTFTVNMYICTQYGAPRGSQLQLMLTYLPDVDMVKVAAVQDPLEWFPPEGYVLIKPVNTLRPKPTGFTLSSQNVVLNFGDSQNVTARLTPTGAVGSIQFKWNGAPSANFTEVSGTEILISATASVRGETTGTIIATLLDENGQPVPDVPTQRIKVTVQPKAVASINVLPPNSRYVTLSISRGIRSARLDIVVDDPTGLLSNDDKAILSDPASNGAGADTLICSVSPDLMNPGTATVTIQTKETAKAPTTVYFTINATNKELVTPLTIVVMIDD